MSVVVKTMKMPKSCLFCRFQNVSFCYAFYDRPGEGKYITTEFLSKKRPDWCPLFEIKDWRDV